MVPNCVTKRAYASGVELAKPQAWPSSLTDAQGSRSNSRRLTGMSSGTCSGSPVSSGLPRSVAPQVC